MQTPKYNIGDEIFFIAESKLTFGPITGIWARYTDDNKFDEYRYGIGKSHKLESYKFTWLPERLAYSSKEDYIASL